MSAPLRILCAVDFSRPAQAAFERALTLSRDRSAELTVVHAVPASERFNRRARARMDRIAALRDAADRAGVHMRVSEQQGDPVGVILLHANAGRFDLIVLGTHGRAAVDRLRSGSVAEQVTERATCPVLVVPVSEDGSGGVPTPFGNIMCPVDFTEGSHAALEHAFRLAKGGRLTLVHVSGEPMSATRYQSRSRVPEYSRLLHQAAWQRLQDAVPVAARTTGDVRARLVSGAPVAEIVRVADEIDADLIVMSVTSRGPIGRSLTSSRAARVIRLGGRPVLAVPERLLKRPGAAVASKPAARLAA